MMKTSKLAILALSAMMIAACTDKKDSQREEHTTEAKDPETSILHLRDIDIKDSTTVEGRMYKYHCAMRTDDSLPIVINPQGLQYKECSVSVSVTRGEEQIFTKTFAKRDFASYVTEDFLKSSTLVGVNYNHIKADDHSALYFIITLGDPDETSDMTCSFELKVASNGSHTIKKAQNIETAPISTGLNVDPKEGDA
ncbi:MAG: DUF4738 domain-containing protein [Bacteroidaceae bacterium]|nr:DUF4738 domain-containing protein [Bacteroidaceae bacterium]